MREIKIAFDPSKIRLVDPKTLKVDPKNRIELGVYRNYLDVIKTS